MAAGRLLIPGWMPALDEDGNPIPNARVFFYLNKTTTLAAVFSDEAMTVPLVNPVPSNASGRFPAVWADDSVLYSASVDAPYGPAGIPFTYDDLSASMAADILVAGAAEAAADEAQQTLVEIQAAIDAASQAGGGDAALAGAIAGSASGAAAASAVLIDKADTDLDNVPSSTLEQKSLTASGATVSLELAKLLGLTIHPEHFGAVAGVFTAPVAALNAAALTAAANDGVELFGAGKTYAIDGRWTAPADNVTWRNLRIRQISTNDAAWNETVRFDGRSNITLDNVVIDLNGYDQTKGFSNSNGILINNCINPSLRRVRVINGGAISGIMVQGCINAKAEDCEAADFTSMRASEPSDDIMQGFVANNCVRSTFIRCGGRNLTANWPGRPANWRRYSRGFTISGNEDCEFITPYGHFVDQGVDVTGSVGNKSISISDVFSTDCSTFGFKIANFNAYMSVRGGLVVRAGKSGAVVSAAMSAGGPTPEQCKIYDFMVLDTGANSPWASGRTAYRVTSSPALPGLPAGIDFINCFFYDRQTVKTTDRGFFMEGFAEQPATSAIPLNRLINCGGEGQTAVGNVQQGFPFSDATATGVGTVSIAHDTFTKLDLSTDVYDPANMISSQRIYAKESGRYLLTATVTFNQNGTGFRQLRFTKNGSDQPVYQRSPVVFPTAAENCTVDLIRTVTLLKGEFVEVEAKQTSGSPLLVVLSSSKFELVKLHNLY